MPLKAYSSNVAEASEDSVRDRREWEAAIARNNIEWMAAELRSGREYREVANELSTRTGLDELTAYRWIFYLGERYLNDIKRMGRIGLVLMWIGAGLSIITGVSFLVGTGSVGGLIAGLAVVGIGGAIVGIRTRVIQPRLEL